MKRVLVTGASGFIGWHLIKHLLQLDCAVRALVRTSSQPPAWSQHVELVYGEVQDAVAMHNAVAGCDTVFHLAGKAHALTELSADDVTYQTVNVEGTRHVLDAAVAHGVERFVFFSSVKAMGEETAGCVDESFPPCPLTAYGRSKLAAEHMVLQYGQQHPMHTVCLRLPLVYGPGNKGNLFRMIAAIEQGRFPPLPHVENRRSMVHVMDVVKAASLVATHPVAHGQCYIVTDGEAYSTRALYDMLCQQLGKPLPRWHIPLFLLKALGHTGDLLGRLRGRRWVFDSDSVEKLFDSAWYSCTKISTALGYQPSITFQKALPGLIAWYHKV